MRRSKQLLALACALSLGAAQAAFAETEGDFDDGEVGNIDDGALDDLDEGDVGNIDDGAVDDVDDGDLDDVDDGEMGDSDDGDA